MFAVVAAFDNVLSPAVLAAAQQAFNPDASFWEEHHYPTPNFFSYYSPLPLNTSTPEKEKGAMGTKANAKANAKAKANADTNVKAKGKGKGKGKANGGNDDGVGAGVERALEGGVLDAVIAAVQPLAQKLAGGKVQFGGEAKHCLHICVHVISPSLPLPPPSLPPLAAPFRCCECMHPFH